MRFQLEVTDFESWRDVARCALQADVPPEEIEFFQSLPDEERSLFGNAESHALPSPAVKKSLRISKPLMDLARPVACHRNPQRCGHRAYVAHECGETRRADGHHA